MRKGEGAEFAADALPPLFPNPPLRSAAVSACVYPVPDAEIKACLVCLTPIGFRYGTHNAAAGIICNRAAAGQPHMGLTTWKKAPDGRVQKSDNTAFLNVK
ncbi:MAG: hypothetical protein SOZ80_06190 [Prevotella sp.]|uniref:hypothetical protein n=1 Tax=Prevotella sp. TaxID=59823 RepID=UPI002A336638|nr:hypothetical protein [Prevotella sp.]MDD7318543.1 hypothetical protein [Prevotellaceae bacterium]MDY4020344.1 hypothetical protein [Prevotella sp.]